MKLVGKARAILTDPAKRLVHDLSMAREIHRQPARNMGANENEANDEDAYDNNKDDDDAFSPKHSWWSTRVMVFVPFSLH